MDKLTREKKLAIVELAESYKHHLYYTTNKDIKLCKNNGFDVNEFIRKLGFELGIDLSIHRNMDEILFHIQNSNNIDNIEEIKEVDRWIDNKNLSLTFVNVNIIIRHMPTGEHYHFVEQRTGTKYSKFKKIIYKGKVKRKEIKTFSWEFVEKEKKEQENENR